MLVQTVGVGQPAGGERKPNDGRNVDKENLDDNVEPSYSQVEEKMAWNLYCLRENPPHPSLINCSSPFHTVSLSPIHWDLSVLEYSLEIILQHGLWRWDMVIATFLDVADIVKSMSPIAREKCPQFLHASPGLCRQQNALLLGHNPSPSPAVLTHFLILPHVKDLDLFCISMPFPNDHPLSIQVFKKYSSDCYLFHRIFFFKLSYVDERGTGLH